MTVVRQETHGDVVIEIVMDTDRMDKMVADAPDLLSAVIQKTAFDVEKYAKVKCPVDTGNLANSIRAEKVVKKGTQVYADIAPHTEYAIYVELGHMTAGKNPTFIPGVYYMTNALTQAGKELETAMSLYGKTLEGYGAE